MGKKRPQDAEMEKRFEKEEEKDVRGGVPFQNSKWKKAAIGSQLSMIIIKIKEVYDLSVKPSGFSWRNLEINGVKMFPTALDQGNSGLCLIYSLLGVSRFQLNLIETEVGEIEYVPSIDYMIRVLDTMSTNCDLDRFLHKLRMNNITDEVEFARVDSLAKKQIKRFALEYEYIDPKADDGIDSIKEAIDTVGSVLLSLSKFELDENEVPVRDENGMKKPILISVDEKVKGKKKRSVRLKLCHVVFCYAWKSENEKVSFQYMNSYGPKFNDKEGHDECTDLDDIIQVFTPQISFDPSGFKKKSWK